MSKTNESPPRLLAVGAHPDDIEFGCGAILLQAASKGAEIALVVCSRGESGSHGSPAERTKEAEAAARELGAELRFFDWEGDGRLEVSRAHAIALAGEIRRFRPRQVLAPSVVADQHPDHVVVGTMVRDAARLARYGGLEIAGGAPHAIKNLFHYAITPGAEPKGQRGLWFDVSAQEADWERLMRCHASQLQTRRYVELQQTRARMRGLEAGVSSVQVLYPAEPLLHESLCSVPGGVRLF